MTKQKSMIPKTDYSSIAEHFDRVRTEPGSLIPLIVKYGKINSSSRVLDVGCGTGRFLTKLLSITNCSLFGVEPSLEMLREAVLKDPSQNITWIQGDGQDLPFSNEVFDCVYMTFVLHHIERKELALQEIYRVLKKSGKCVILTTSHAQIKRHVLNDFPGVTTIDLKRLPSIPCVRKNLIKTSFKAIHYHIFYRQENTSTERYLERVKNKYISTLTLFNEEEFQKRFKVFRERVHRKYGDKIERISGFVFIEARK